MSETKLYIYGAGAHGKVLADIAEQLGMRIAGAFDKNLLRKTLLDQYTVHMGLGDMHFDQNDRFVIGILNNEYRKRIAEEDLAGKRFASIEDKTVSLSRYAEVDPGTVLLAYAVVATDVQLGAHCIVGMHAAIEADAVVENYVHIDSGVRIGSEVLVGEGTHIGSGAIIMPGVTIGRWCSISPGTVVSEDVSDGTVIGA